MDEPMHFTPLPPELFAAQQKKMPRFKKILLLFLIFILVGGLGAGILALRSTLVYKTPAKTPEEYEREKACSNIPDCLKEFKPPCPIHPDCQDNKPGCTSPPEGYCKIKTEGLCFECYTSDRGIRMICMCPQPTTPPPPTQIVEPCREPYMCITIGTIPTSSCMPNLACPSADQICCLPAKSTPTPAYKPTATPQPTREPTITPAPSECPVPKQVENLTISCPVCK